jgi:hypothetical protein
MRMMCAYAYCFETPPPPETTRLRKNQAIPHPLLLHPPEFRTAPWEEGEILHLKMTLFGRAIEFFPHLALAFALAGRRGLGNERTPFRLLSIHDLLHPHGESEIWDPKRGYYQTLQRRDAASLFDLDATPPERARITLLSPLRLVQESKDQNAPIRPQRFKGTKSLNRQPRFRDFAASLFQRFSSILYFHCDYDINASFPPSFFREMMDAAATIQEESTQLHYIALERHSARQDQKIPLNGMNGEIIWHGDALRLWWPLLLAGSLLHVGKSTLFGLGHYRVEALPSLVI